MAPSGFHISKSKQAFLRIGLLALIGFALWKIFTLIDTPAVDSEHKIVGPTLSEKPKETPIITPENTSTITFSFNEENETGKLKAISATRISVLEHIVDYFGFTLDTDAQEKDFLEETISLEINSDMADIFATLLVHLPIRIVQTHDWTKDENNRESITLCIGEYACADSHHAVNSAQQEENFYLPSMAFMEALEADITPDASQQIDWAERSRILKEEYPLLDAQTKMKVLYALSSQTDLAFFIEQLNHEEHIALREIAARKLFPPTNPESLSALLECLSDPNEIFVLKILGILSRSNDEELRYQASSLLSDHPSPLIQEGLIKLGFISG